MLIGILFAIALIVGGVILFIVTPRYKYDVQKWGACFFGGFFSIMISIVIVIAMCTAPSGSSSTNKNNSSSHECYICGDDAYQKYCGYYYCSHCLYLVKEFS